MVVTPAPVRVLTQRPLVPVSHRLQARPRTFHLAHMLPPMPIKPQAATKKTLLYSQCNGDTSCLGPYPMASSPEFQIGQAENFSSCPRIYKVSSSSKLQFFFLKLLELQSSNILLLNIFFLKLYTFFNGLFLDSMATENTCLGVPFAYQNITGAIAACHV